MTASIITAYLDGLALVLVLEAEGLVLNQLQDTAEV